MFFTKRNWLTSYGLGCGYIETTDSKRYNLTLFSDMNNGASWSVRLHDFKTHKRVFWESFHSLVEARKRFMQECKKLGITRKKD